MQRLHVDLAEPDSRLSGGAALEGRLRIVQTGRDVDRAACHERFAGSGRPRGQPRQSRVELHDRAADIPVLEATAVVGRHRITGDHGEQPLRVGVADDTRRGDERAVFEPHTLAGHDLADRDAAGEHRARVLRGVGDREADHAHAATHVAPDRALVEQVALDSA